MTEWEKYMYSDPDAPFWVVWNPHNGSPTVKHSSHESACREAERLSRLNPKTRFFVLEAKGSCTFDPQPVTWVKVDPTWVPF